MSFPIAANLTEDTLMGTAVTPFITHAMVKEFAEKSVNLRREDAREYRRAVNRLRDKVHDLSLIHI